MSHLPKHKLFTRCLTSENKSKNNSKHETQILTHQSNPNLLVTLNAAITYLC